MAVETPVPLSVVIINPNLSHRSLKAMVISRDDEGNFAHHEEHDADVMIQDGMTTIVALPPGSRIVIREENDPPMADRMVSAMDDDHSKAKRHAKTAFFDHHDMPADVDRSKMADPMAMPIDSAKLVTPPEAFNPVKPADPTKPAKPDVPVVKT